MTEDEIREDVRRRQESGEWVPVESAKRLLGIIDELRRLPVIASCEVCPHGSEAEGRQLYCFHKAAPRENDGNPRRVKRKGMPPSWCPWRGQP